MKRLSFIENEMADILKRLRRSFFMGHPLYCITVNSEILYKENYSMDKNKLYLKSLATFSSISQAFAKVPLDFVSI